MKIKRDLDAMRATIVNSMSKSCNENELRVEPVLPPVMHITLHEETKPILASLLGEEIERIDKMIEEI